MTDATKDLTTRLNDTFKNLKRRTHAATVLVGASIIDQQLEFAILTKMRKLNRKVYEELFTGYGPLSSFSAKIAMAYALELINGPARSRLSLLRKIRNEFAHSDDVNFSFEDPDARALMASLAKDCTTGETEEQLYIWHLKQIEDMLVANAGPRVVVPGVSVRKQKRKK